ITWFGPPCAVGARIRIMKVRNKVDTETSAMIKYDVSLDSGTSARLSEISKYTEQVAERGGCPLSFTEITRFCFMLSDSVIHAFCPESASTAITLETREPDRAALGTISVIKDFPSGAGYNICGELSFSSVMNTLKVTLLLSGGEPLSLATTWTLNFLNCS
uniref:Uncharacterized protein n=1 Tax=Electrophorus electricus TaxID=8005 RepID=A0AAY5EV74_ELEEL